MNAATPGLGNSACYLPMKYQLAIVNSTKLRLDVSDLYDQLLSHCPSHVGENELLSTAYRYVNLFLLTTGGCEVLALENVLWVSLRHSAKSPIAQDDAPPTASTKS